MSTDKSEQTEQTEQTDSDQPEQKESPERLRIVNDDDEMKRFIDNVLVFGETYMVYLAARKKYTPGREFRTKGCEAMERKLFTHSEKYPYQLIRLLRKYEVLASCFINIDGIIIPPDSYAAYISVTPRDIKSATLGLMNDLTKSAFSGEFAKKPKRVETLFKRHVQKNHQSGYYTSIDWDSTDEEQQKKLMKRFEENEIKPHFIIHTRGGLHIHIKKDQMKKGGQWLHQKFPNEFPEEVDGMRSDLFSAIPGTIQGGHNVFAKYF